MAESLGFALITPSVAAHFVNHDIAGGMEFAEQHFNVSKHLSEISRFFVLAVAALRHLHLKIKRGAMLSHQGFAADKPVRGR